MWLALVRVRVRVRQLALIVLYHYHYVGWVTSKYYTQSSTTISATPSRHGRPYDYAAERERDNVSNVCISNVQVYNTFFPCSIVVVVIIILLLLIITSIIQIIIISSSSLICSFPSSYY